MAENGRPRADFLTSLAERALGTARVVKPRPRPRFGHARPGRSAAPADLLAERIEQVAAPAGGRHENGEPGDEETG